MKFLTVCRGGIVRSVAMRRELVLSGQDAVAVGHDFNSPETIAMLMEWADWVILMQPTMFWMLPKEARQRHKHKIRVCNVGEDIWGDSFHPDLREQTEAAVDEWKRLKWVLPADPWESERN